ncbi:hypothetical protein CsSME_00007708 [Camellia sinensis var. sinensis]
MEWLIHSMVSDIGESYLSIDTTRDIWDAVATTYSQKENFSQTFTLRRSIEHSVHGKMTILQYFTFLSNGWKHLNHLQDYKLACPTDFVGYRKFIEQDRIFKFLKGFNVEFDPFQRRVLRMDVLPSLQEAFSYLQNEESRRLAMLPPISIECSVLASAPPRDKDRLSRGTRNPSMKDTLDRGDRSGSQGGRSEQSRGCGVVDIHDSAPAVLSTDIVFGMSSSEFENALRYLLDRQTSTTPTAASSSWFVHNLASSTNVFLYHKTLPWIIDSDASDHMIESSDLFSEYTSSSGQDKIRIADGRSHGSSYHPIFNHQRRHLALEPASRTTTFFIT